MATAAPKFVAGPVLSHGPPKSPPPKLPGYGDSCFRATCYLERDDAQRLASFVGYDATLAIIGEVEGTCRIHAKKHPGATCTDTKLTFLGATAHECSGQIYFHYERPDCSM